jgi:hypothetical protein
MSNPDILQSVPDEVPTSCRPGCSHNRISSLLERPMNSTFMSSNMVASQIVSISDQITILHSVTGEASKGLDSDMAQR